jgi:hypothetical protein
MISFTYPKRIALVIDAENTQLQYIEEILRLSAYIGDLVVKSAYGDWSKPQISSYKERLEKLKIDCIQVKNVGENSSDFGLSIGIGEIFPRYINTESPDILMLVSGDKHFAQVCEYIREQGKNLVIIGGKQQTSPVLKNFCDKLYYLEDLQQDLHEFEKQYPIHPTTLRQVFRHLDKIFAFNSEDPYSGLNYDVVEKQLHEKHSNSSANLGSYRLSECLKYFGEQFERRGERIIVNPHLLRRMALSMAYTNAKQEDDLISLDLFSKCLLKSATKFSPNFYKTYFHGKKLSGWLAMYSDTFEVHENRITLVLNYSSPD